MKAYCKTLALTAVISALSMPVLAQSASDTGTHPDPSAANEAAQMIPAIATLPHTWDADKDHLDSTIEAELYRKVTLSDGTVLPAHTLLTGKITRDNMQVEGTSEFSVRFDQAQLKDGKTVPVKATIVDVKLPDLDSEYTPSNDWTEKTLSVQQIGVVSGVDLHSEIASNDSAVFVSTKKHDVKVPAGSELKLAIGPASDVSTPTK